MERIYLDNASTTFPKPELVTDCMLNYLKNQGVNINRGGYQSAYQVEEMVYDTREMIRQLFQGDDCRNVVFTANITQSLNMLLKGILKPGDHVLVSAMEHNAVMRPLVQLEKQNISFTRIPCYADGTLDFTKPETYLRPNTKMLIMTHASNVCGTVLPLEKVGQFCKKHNLLFVVDAAQTAGILPISMKSMQIDALAFTGHKGLMGPQGIGGFILRDGLQEQMEPLICGGTGSMSHKEQMPSFLPDRFEAGTLNLPGIAGLYGALTYLEQIGIDRVYQQEIQLTDVFLRRIDGLRQKGFLEIAGRKDTVNRIGVVSITSNRIDLARLAEHLDTDYGIQTRVGLHCAPNAHKILGTYPQGTLRFSFGLWNTVDEIEITINALEDIFHGL